MSRSGPRPHCWKHQGEIPHRQHLAWLQMRAQANYRREVFELTLEDFQHLWADHWHKKGRSNADYCLARIDSQGPWRLDNVACMPRIDHLRRQKTLIQEK
jgi:hypothetical protein